MFPVKQNKICPGEYSGILQVMTTLKNSKIKSGNICEMFLATTLTELQEKIKDLKFDGKLYTKMNLKYENFLIY